MKSHTLLMKIIFSKLRCLAESGGGGEAVGLPTEHRDANRKGRPMIAHNILVGAFRTGAQA